MVNIETQSEAPDQTNCFLSTRTQSIPICNGLFTDDNNNCDFEGFVRPRFLTRYGNAIRK